MNQAITLLGAAFDPLTTDGAVARIGRMIAERRPSQVVTANVDFLFQASHDPGMRRILDAAALTLCDGAPLVWASRLLGHPLPGRVAGADLVPRLLHLAEARGHRVYFLGATPESNERAVANVLRRHPRLEVAGRESPPCQPIELMDNAGIVGRIRASNADLLLVAFGCPKAEKWIARHLRETGVPVAIGVGCTFDLLAGAFRRAPCWMQGLGLEWFFRLLQEPRRLFGRYAADFGFLCRSVPAEWWRTRAARH